MCIIYIYFTHEFGFHDDFPSSDHRLECRRVFLRYQAKNKVRLPEDQGESAVIKLVIKRWPLALYGAREIFRLDKFRTSQSAKCSDISGSYPNANFAQSAAA